MHPQKKRTTKSKKFYESPLTTKKTSNKLEHFEQKQFYNLFHRVTNKEFLEMVRIFKLFP